MATRRWAYFDGSHPRPTPKDASDIKDDEKTAIDKWDQEDTAASYLLSQRLPDTTAIRLASLPTHTRWSRVTEEYTAKSIYAQNDLEQSFLEMRCPKGGDVRTFLNNRSPGHPQRTSQFCIKHPGFHPHHPPALPTRHRQSY